MKYLIVFFLSVFGSKLIAQNHIVSETKSFNFTKKEIKGNQIVFEIENMGEQPFVAFDLKINGIINKKGIINMQSYLGFENKHSYGEPYIRKIENKQLKQDIHFDNENAWSSELQFLSTNTKFITFSFENLGNNIENIDFNFFYPNKTEKLSKSLVNEQVTGTKSINCSCPIPAYENRTDWDPTGTHPAQTTPTFTTVTHLIVHHAAGPNTSSDWAATVRSIWNFHVNSNGWSDIGYNYLIDPNGIIYEGRGDNVIGAHFSGMNGGTMGVCLLGNYQPDVVENVDPTQAMQNSLVELLSWKECDIDKDPLLSSFHGASNQIQMHISGHRDAGTGTACPGDNVYDILPNLRSSCSAYIPNCAFSSNADLVVSSLGTNPSTVVVAENTTIELAVGNGGSQDAIESLNVELKVDGSLIQSFTMDSILSGEIIDFTFPNYQFTSIGMHQICVYIDSASNETNTVNNSYCFNVEVEDSVQLFSDLVVADITSNITSPMVGESTVLDFRLLNSGDDSTNETVDGTIKIDGLTKQIFNIPVLNINQSFLKPFTTSFNTPGNHSVCVEMESPSNETNSANNSFCKNINVEALNSSILNTLNLEAFGLFPNPAKNILKLELNLKATENLNISITNNIGQIIFEKKISNKKNYKENISVKDLSTGIYFIKIQGEKTVLNRTFIKQ